MNINFPVKYENGCVVDNKGNILLKANRESGTTPLTPAERDDLVKIVVYLLNTNEEKVNFNESFNEDLKFEDESLNEDVKLDNEFYKVANIIVKDEWIDPEDVEHTNNLDILIDNSIDSYIRHDVLPRSKRKAEFLDNNKGEIFMHIKKLLNIHESLNEEIQILDKVRYNKDRGYVTGEIEGKVIVMIQGSTYLVDPKDLKEWNKKPDLTTEPHMKFDEETQKLLFEQYVRCGIYQGNMPVKMNDCYVKYSHWQKAPDEQMIKVLVEGNTTFLQKSNVRILEDLNDFANEDNYIPGVLIDEATEEVVENILVQAIDYANAIGDADSIRIIRKSESGEQEMQTVPKAMVRTLAV